MYDRDPTNGVLWGGSDPRADGCAIGFESAPINVNDKQTSKL